MKRPRVDPGEYLVVCDRTGFRVLASSIRREWNNLLVWDQVYEPRQPQDYLRGVPDPQAVPFSRPKTAPVFIDDDNPVSPDDL